MRFIMMIKSNDHSEATNMPDTAAMDAMAKYNEALLDAGILRGAEGLHRSSEGARVRIANGKTSIIDGPFSETKELVAGYWVIEAKSKEEAVAWAKRVPAGDAVADIEVRPLYEPEDFPLDMAEQPAPASPPPAATPDKGPRWISMLKADENTEAAMKANDKLLAEMGALMGEMIGAGLLITGDGIKPTSEGAKVRFDKGKVSVVDGPFTESKEIVAGITVYRAKTKSQAVEWARRCLQIHMDGTGIATGEIEVRRVHEVEEIPVQPDETPDGWRATERRMREELSY